MYFDFQVAHSWFQFIRSTVDYEVALLEWMVAAKHEELERNN